MVELMWCLMEVGEAVGLIPAVIKLFLKKRWDVEISNWQFTLLLLNLSLRWQALSTGFRLSAPA
jgi:hypothetical protein